MKSEPKKDDKQRIIMENKGIKNDIVRRQTKQIIRQSKAKLNNAGDNEESEQKGDNYAVNRLEQQGKASGKYVAKKSKFLLKGQFRNLARRKRRAKLSEKEITQKLRRHEFNNAVNIAKNKQKKNLNYNANLSRKAVPNRDGFSWLKRYFFKNKSNYNQDNAINIANNEKKEKGEVNFVQNVDRNALQQQFIRQKRKEMLTDCLFEQKTKIQGQKFIRNREQIERLIAALKKAVTVKTVSILGVIAAVIMLAALAGGATAVVKTPFGVFYSGVDGYENSIAKAIAEINAEFEKKKEELLKYPADRVVITHLPAGTSDLMITNWNEVVAVFAANTASDKTNATDVAVIDEARKNLLRQTFWDMNELTHEVEVITHGSGEDAWTETVLYITLTSKTHEQMIEEYDFTPYQITAVNELLKPEYAQMMAELIGNFDENVTVNTAEIEKLLANLPPNLSLERRAIVTKACSLVGKVNYFWGGKSSAIGWDNRWGTPMKVTAPGSRTTGTVRPFGLDCSGFVDWVFNNACGYILGQGGGAHAQHNNCRDITFAEVLPGDLLFYPDDSHVGIAVGRDGNGEILVIHCAGGYNNVVLTTAKGFTSAGRAVE